jgi:hypothetical protein
MKFFIVSAIFMIMYIEQTFCQCYKDTDCKGDRICLDGKCVDPQLPTIQPDTKHYSKSDNRSVSGKTGGPDCSAASIKGSNDAQMYYNASGWWGAGILSGLFFNVIGTGVTYAIASGSDPAPQAYAIPQGFDMNCYVDGYKISAKNKNRLAAGVGGLVGSALAIAAVFLIAASN